MRDLPPPLPPEARTIGQVIAETIRAYGSDFWRALPLGVPVAIADQLEHPRARRDPDDRLLGAAPLFVAGYIWACSLFCARGRP